MGKVSPSNVLKITEQDQSSYLNNETYLMYFTEYMLLCTSMFEWSNLPNNIPERFIEKSLFNYGKLAFVEDENIGFIVTKCAEFDQLNLYDEAIGWNCYSDNGYWKNYRADEIEIIRNNKYSIPTVDLMQHHLRRLYDIERTIDSNLWQQRNLAIIKSNEDLRLTMKNLIKKIDEHGYMVYANDSMKLNEIDVLNFNIPYIGLELEQHKEIKRNELLNKLGINTVNSNKRERLITDEANANNQMIQLNVDVMLAERKIAVDRINERFNLNIEVKLRNEIKEIGGEEVEDGRLDD